MSDAFESIPHKPIRLGFKFSTDRQTFNYCFFSLFINNLLFELTVI